MVQDFHLLLISPFVGHFHCFVNIVYFPWDFQTQIYQILICLIIVYTLIFV